MLQVSPVSPTPTPTPAPAPTAGQSTTDVANNAFGLSFESLLQIILTQLTYQDPLKPVENFEFVSQLAQFSQIQQGQVISDRLQQLVAAQTTAQATNLLGRNVDIAAGNSVISGTVTALAIQNGDARLTIQTQTGQTISNLALSSITQIREAN
jgi:flagellar basal-body rod modification protein FlgD